MLIKNPLVILDLETTGTWVEKDKIIEIAMIRLELNGTRKDYLKRINPNMPLPGVVTELTGIADSDLAEAPYFRNVALEILDFLEEADLAGFNLERFDLPLLERELRESGHVFDWKKVKVYDAQKIYHLNEKRNLSAAYRFYCGKELKNAHSALGDAEATLEILSAQVEKYGDTGSGPEVLEKFEYQDNGDFFGQERRFRWWNGRLYMMFGKYARKLSLQEIVSVDRKYLEWIISARFSDEVKEVVKNALQGRFPVREWPGD